MKTQVIIIDKDLAASPLNPTGWARLKSRVISAYNLFNDKEILSKIGECRPSLIAVDTLLSQPKSTKIHEKS